MEKLDQLIAKFKEVKEDLESPSNDTPEKEGLEKFYVSPVTRLAGKKDNPTPKAASTKPTGIDKIKAVSKETINPTSIISEDQKRAKAMGAPTNPTASKLTGLDRIKAESMKPLLRSETADNKFESKKFEKTINNSYAPATNSTPSNMAMSADEKLSLNKGGQWDLRKDALKPGAPKFANVAAAPSGIGHTPGKGATYGAGGYQITQPFPQPKVRGAAGAVGAASPTPNTVAAAPRSLASRATPAHDVKTQVPLGGGMPTGVHAAPGGDEKTQAGLPPHMGPDTTRVSAQVPTKPSMRVAKGECSKCHADPCECQTSGVLVDKADKSCY